MAVKSQTILMLFVTQCALKGLNEIYFYRTELDSVISDHPAQAELTQYPACGTFTKWINFDLACTNNYIHHKVPW